MTPQPDQTSAEALPAFQTRITERRYDAGRYLLTVTDYNNRAHPGGMFTLHDASDGEGSFKFHGNDPDLALILAMLSKGLEDLKSTRSAS